MAAAVNRPVQPGASKMLRRALGFAMAALVAASPAWAADADGCRQQASPACYQALTLPDGGGTLHYYASLPDGATPGRAVVALHGHPRDADRTFDATLAAVRLAGASNDVLVIAPVFQVSADRAASCSAPGTPAAQEGDLLWTCASWIEGGRAANFAQPTSFAVLDAVVADVARRWPALRGITVAGFSAGAQMVQHAIGFARPPSPGPVLRYLVSDPGTWLYFDPFPAPPTPPASPAADADACPDLDRWKYGTADLPAALGRSAAEARARYAAADITYMAGALDDADRPGAYYRILDKSCAARAQGPFRLQRAQAYAAYDRAMLSPNRPRPLIVVPGCAHDVACVFPSPAARGALLGPAR